MLYPRLSLKLFKTSTFKAQTSSDYTIYSRGGATFTEVGGTNHGERSEPENFFVVPPKRGYKYHFAPSNRGYKIIAKITRRLVQKCTTWFRSTNFTSCSPQNHCTVIFYYGTRYWPISRFCHIFLSPFTVFNAFP